jgi:hypothetical protein
LPCESADSGAIINIPNHHHNQSINHNPSTASASRLIFFFLALLLQTSFHHHQPTLSAKQASLLGDTTCFRYMPTKTAALPLSS